MQMKIVETDEKQYKQESEQLKSDILVYQKEIDQVKDMVKDLTADKQDLVK